MRRVRGPRGEVHEERLLRRERFHRLRPADRLVGHVGHEMVVRILRGLDLVQSFVERRRPLVGLAADEAVELVEARAGRPAVGRTGGAHFPGRGLVRLAERRGGEAVEPEHLGQGRHAVGSLAGLPGERGGRLRDRTHVAHVMIPAGEQGRPRRRAERRGVKVIVPQPAPCQPIGRWHVDGPSERAGLTESHVVDQHDEHVGGAGRGLHLESRRGLGIPDIELGDGRIVRFGYRAGSSGPGPLPPPTVFSGAEVSAAGAPPAVSQPARMLMPSKKTGG